MDLHDEYVIGITQKVLLPMLEQIASYDLENQDENRGKMYFIDNPTVETLRDQLPLLGNTFIRMILECLFVWSIWHPQDTLNNQSKFKKTYQNLLDMGVKFPKLAYYKLDVVK